MNTISEQTAAKLAQAFHDMCVAMHRSRTVFIDLSMSINKLAESIVNKRISELATKAMLYKYNYINASWLTRCYWKRKYKKADKMLQAFVVENSPIPDVSIERKESGDLIKSFMDELNSK